MNTNEVIWELLRSGFPLLILVVYGMILYRTWTHEKFDASNKWKWTAILILPGILGLVCFFTMFRVDPLNIGLINTLTVLALFLPFSGVLAWLLGTR